ncbi:MAG: hypothetical protein M3019_03915 [Candidatus Dormibacteraeota bacterium]|nr:hypothetical protein [Candidatus Dormibacteraeota bacterium]
MTSGREVHLAGHPHGEPTPDDFALVEVDVRRPGEGEVAGLPEPMVDPV